MARERLFSVLFKTHTPSFVTHFYCSLVFATIFAQMSFGLGPYYDVMETGGVRSLLSQLQQHDLTSNALACTLEDPDWLFI